MVFSFYVILLDTVSHLLRTGLIETDYFLHASEKYVFPLELFTCFLKYLIFPIIK